MPPDRRPLPQKSRNAPAQTTAGARRTPPPFGSVPDRNGYFSPPEKKSRRPIVVAAIIVILILIAALIIIPKLGKGSAAPLETEEQVITETLPETEPEPEPQLPPYTYASRNADTKQLGDEISCAHAILIDVESNTVIAEKGGDEKIFPASMTKVMTALAAVGKCDDLNDTFTMTAEIVAPLFQANATVAGFSPGEVITVKDLLYGAILPSGADGTGGLAEYTSGSEAAFAAVMNEKCTELGLKGTHFSNASGLHAEDHYSTCHDIAIIFEAAMDDPDIAPALGSAEYVTTKTTEHPDGLELHHTLLYERLEGSEEFDEKIEVIGGKTGYTDEAGNCLVTMAKVASTGKRYVFVCAGGNGKWAPVFDTIHVYRNYLGEHYDGEFVPKSQRQD
jgi:D-alanyl-D-alanine carboxypeptidase (penicillin-binding protein 5/6)